MTARQRRIHRWVWRLLGPAVLIGLIVAMGVRP